MQLLESFQVHSERPKLYIILAFLSAIGLAELKIRECIKDISKTNFLISQYTVGNHVI